MGPNVGGLTAAKPSPREIVAPVARSHARPSQRVCAFGTTGRACRVISACAPARRRRLVGRASARTRLLGAPSRAGQRASERRGGGTDREP